MSGLRTVRDRRTVLLTVLAALASWSCSERLPNPAIITTGPLVTPDLNPQPLACQSDSTADQTRDTLLIDSAGQFPVASSDGSNGTVIAFRGRGAHVDIQGRIDFAVLDSAAHLVQRISPSELDSPVDDRNPAFIALNSQEWLLLYAEMTPGGPGGTFDISRAVYHIRFSRTTDGGRTWSAPRTPPLPGIDTLLASPYGKMRQLPDGRVLAAIYDSQDSMSNYYSYNARLLVSPDHGQTWLVQSTLPQLHNETAFLPVGGDTVVAAMRSGANWLEITSSPDLGQTWTPAFQLTELNQVAGDLAQLPNGELLLVYGSRTSDPKGIQYRLLRRQGLEIFASPEGLVVPVGTSGIDFGYPSIVKVLPDGVVSLVYYVSGADVPGVTQMRYAVFCPYVVPRVMSWHNKHASSAQESKGRP